MSDVHGMPLLQPIAEIPTGSRVLLRMDLDVPMNNGQVVDADRLIKSVPTLTLLLEKQCVVVIIGHLGRPNGVDAAYSLTPVFAKLLSLVKSATSIEIHEQFVKDVEINTAFETALQSSNLICLENLRFYKGEKANDPQFLQHVVGKMQWFVNDALAVAHRKHWSMMLHKIMKTAYGIAFINEVTKLMTILQKPDRPITIILGGAKEDKLSYLSGLEKIADHILIGGKLPMLINNKNELQQNPQYYVATLNEEKLDLNVTDIERFTSTISSSKTIIWAGAMGLFENPLYKRGTEAIARAVVASGAYTILAGGDTESSVSQLGEEKRINLVASGGGVMLELLTKGTLPAWS